MFRGLFAALTGALLCCATAPAFAVAASPARAPQGQGFLFDGGLLAKLGARDNLCAITFDDGPSKHTNRLLDLLNERRVPATFFVVGTQVERRPDVIRRMQREGYEVGNHTYSHQSLRHLSRVEQTIQIGRVQELLAGLGVTSRFLRPPFGRYDVITKAIARDLGMDTALWSVDSNDWRRKARLETLTSVTGGHPLRGVYLFHDTHQPTIDAMPELLDQLAQAGCRFVTLSDYLDPPAELLATPAPAVSFPASHPTGEVPHVASPDATGTPAPGLTGSGLTGSGTPATVLPGPALPGSALHGTNAPGTVTPHPSGSTPANAHTTPSHAPSTAPNRPQGASSGAPSHTAVPTSSDTMSGPSALDAAPGPQAGGGQRPEPVSEDESIFTRTTRGLLNLVNRLFS